MEIHGSRAVPLKEKYEISWNELFFRVLMLPRRYVRFCKIGSMERQKRITFKKKVYQKIFICRGDILFFRAKTVKFPQKFGTFPKGNQWKSIFEISNLHWFPFENIPGFGGNSTLFCSQKWYISSTNKYFLINFFWKLFFFDAPPIRFYRTSRNGAEAWELQK